MRILIDKYVPFLQGVLDSYADVSFLEPEQFTPEAVHYADALIIRTRTRCDADLLMGSHVRFIATATIGTDHIDLDYCRANNIQVVSCPGCNAKAVCDYIEEALIEVVRGSFEQLSIGVVGLGHVGKRVYRMARNHGMRVVISDPPLNLTGDVTECDIITFHTPLTYIGEHSTWHLCDEKFLSRCKPDALIINAARGGVVDEQALLRSGHPFIIDTWEGEPKINRGVLERARLASYHIAGYSISGKRNASRQCLEALCEYFDLPQLKVNKEPADSRGDKEPGWLTRITRQLKAHPEAFEQLRKEYRLR
ncbi:MAG: 4-phosphoerythronate dehydrogenase [Paludibacteraceae bacterium]|nr:4-phosphoerythronate dehydrogenase [Paludibacteraceae bacterium]